MSHRSRVFKTQVLCKKNFTYSDVFKPYSDVLKPYSGIFMQFVEIESLKLDFHVDFFPHHPSSYKSRLKNLNFILKLEF